MGNYGWNNNTVDSFSAACFSFAEGLTELAEQNNETAVPLGLISSSWGGTVVEVWTPNATLVEGTCKYVDGNATADFEGKGFGPRPGGSLWTGMIAPYLNYSIFGALWYQVSSPPSSLPLAPSYIFLWQWLDTELIGTLSALIAGREQCISMPALRSPWRPQRLWSCRGWHRLRLFHGADGRRMEGRLEWNPTGRDLRHIPFRHRLTCRCVSYSTCMTVLTSVLMITHVSNKPTALAGGTSEGHSNAMPAFRNAQTAGGGLLPNKLIPNSFVAQAFDAGEPAGEVPGGSCEMNDQTDEGGYPCTPGFAPFTPFFMGGIHPRAKRVVGQRLAKAARNIAYGDTTQAYTGPVLVGCEMAPDPYPGREPDPKHSLPVEGPRLRLTFNSSLLGEADSLTVRQPGWELQIHGPPNPHTPYPMSLGLRGQPYADLHAAGLLTEELLKVLTQTWRPGASGNNHNLLYTSPLEVRYGGSASNLSDGGLWLSARLEPLCYNKGPQDSQNPNAMACGRNATTGERLPGWNVASAA
eukprot:SAG22_NODE_631_length_8376_cov_43.396037_6_plen_525_part_00